LFRHDGDPKRIDALPHCKTDNKRATSEIGLYGFARKAYRAAENAMWKLKASFDPIIAPLKLRKFEPWNVSVKR
jgi:hypothetical protein